MIYFEFKGYENIGEVWVVGEKIDCEIIVVDEVFVLVFQLKLDQVWNECRIILEFIV